VRPSEKDLARFWAKVEKSDGCWEWTSAKSRAGYGVFRLGGKTVYAHRLSMFIAGTPIPNGLHGCHHCDNRSCVRPDHIFSGTDRDNHNDMVAKGRGALPPVNHGERHPQCRYSDDFVRKAIAMAKASTIRGAARALGLSQRTVQRWTRGTSRIVVEGK
jgi:hypothetical protein